MKRAVLSLLALAACASAPAPKAPEEAHRVPVNRSAPAELGAGTPQRPDRRAPSRGTGEVYWR